MYICWKAVKILSFVLDVILKINVFKYKTFVQSYSRIFELNLKKQWTDFKQFLFTIVQ